MKNRILLTSLIDDKEIYDSLLKKLEGLGFQVKSVFLNEEEKENKIRAAILRTDAVIILSCSESLSNNSFYTGYDVVKNNSKNKPVINVICADSIDAEFESVYSNESLGDDIVLKADDYKNELNDNNSVALKDDINALLDLLKKNDITPGDVVKKAEPEVAEIKPIMADTIEVKEEPKKVDAKEEPKAEKDSLSQMEIPNPNKEEKESFTGDEMITCKECGQTVKKQLFCPYCRQRLDLQKPEEVKPEPMTMEEKLKAMEIKKPEKNEPKEEKVEVLKHDENRERKYNENTLKKAMDKFDDGDYENALSLFMDTEDHPKAMEYIGYCYMVGLGCTKDTSEAYYYYKKAVDSGNDNAVSGLADCYYYGYGTPKNDKMALMYYEKESNKDEEIIEHIANIYFYTNTDIKSYAQALKLYTSIDGYKNIPQINYNLGLMYLNGWDVNKDLNEAFRLIKLAADMNHIPAMNDCANMLRDGIGCQSNMAEAVRYYEDAAKYNYPEAIKNLGDVYFDGLNGKVDKVKAAAQYKKAAQLKCGDAAYMLGYMHDNAEGIDINTNEALKWYKEGAKLGSGDAAYELGRHYYFAYGVKKDNQEAFKWYLMGAEAGSEKAMYDVALCYHNGSGTEKNTTEAFKWYLRASKYNNVDAIIALGDIYKTGTDEIEKNGDMAAEMYIKAADLGFYQGYVYAGNLYMYGIDVERDVLKAFEYYKLAANTNLPMAQGKFGDCFFNGYGTNQDYKKALTYYKKGAKAGDGHSNYMTGRCYELGVGGVFKNMKEALKYYKEAADKGDTDALYELGEYYTNKQNEDYDLEEGFTMFEDAANKNYTPAMLKLGECYIHGIGCEIDKDYALTLFTKAKNLGSLDADAFITEYFG